MKKKLIQIILFLLIFFLVYKVFFSNDKSPVKNTNIDQFENIENPNNLIKNLRYDVKFENNTQYTITSDLSETTYENDVEVVLMQIVKAIFKDKEGSILVIISDEAKFNNNTYNTYFENNLIKPTRINEINKNKYCRNC